MLPVPAFKFLQNLGIAANYKHIQEHGKPNEFIHLKLRAYPTPQHRNPMAAPMACAINRNCHSVAFQAKIDAPLREMGAVVLCAYLYPLPDTFHYRPDVGSGLFIPSADNVSVTHGLTVFSDEGGYFSYIKLPHSVLRMRGYTVISNGRPIFDFGTHLDQDGFSAKICCIILIGIMGIFFALAVQSAFNIRGNLCNHPL